MLNVSHYVGIPYADKGRNPRVGLDCWGLVMLVQREVFGREVPGYLELYKSAEDSQSVSDAMRAHFKDWDQVWPPQPGDVLIFRVANDPWHAGIHIGDNMMLHTMTDQDSCIEAFDRIRWRDRIFGAFRWKS